LWCLDPNPSGVEEEKMEPVQVPAPETVWESSVLTEEQVQTLATRGLIRPKAEVRWRGGGG
jgi:hypothetical protein